MLSGEGSIMRGSARKRSLRQLKTELHLPIFSLLQQFSIYLANPLSC
jgi:hypothetical protein